MEDIREILMGEWKVTFDNYIQSQSLEDKIELFASVYSITDEPDYYATEVGSKVVNQIIQHLKERYGEIRVKDIEGFKEHIRGIMSKVIGDIKSSAQVAC